MVIFVTFEPPHEISNDVLCETSKGSDQPAHTHDHSLCKSFEYSVNIKLLPGQIWSF